MKMSPILRGLEELSIKEEKLESETADELTARGEEALNRLDFTEAVNCFEKALRIRISDVTKSSDSESESINSTISDETQASGTVPKSIITTTIISDETKSSDSVSESISTIISDETKSSDSVSESISTIISDETQASDTVPKSISTTTITSDDDIQSCDSVPESISATTIMSDETESAASKSVGIMFDFFDEWFSKGLEVCKSSDSTTESPASLGRDLYLKLRDMVENIGNEILQHVDDDSPEEELMIFIIKKYIRFQERRMRVILSGN